MPKDIIFRHVWATHKGHGTFRKPFENTLLNGYVATNNFLFTCKNIKVGLFERLTLHRLEYVLQSFKEVKRGS